MKNRKIQKEIHDIRYPEETDKILNVLRLIRKEESVEVLKGLFCLDDETIETVIHQLKSCGMIEEVEDGKIKASPQGVETLLIYKSFTGFIESKRTEEKVKKSTLWTNYLTMVNFICTFIGFIIGVLLSDPVKQLLWKILSAF